MTRKRERPAGGVVLPLRVLPKPREVSFEEYAEHVKVILVAEEPHEHREDGTLRGDTLYWIHTLGMGYYDRPELEVRGVPAPWARNAGEWLNGWALYTINVKRIEEGQTLADAVDVVQVKYEAQVSPDPWWTAEGFDRGPCLRLVPVAVHASCAGCGKEAP